MLALPGSAYVYGGEELGLPEVEDIPLEAMQDPTVKQTFGADPGRDGCRVPLPWTTTSGSNAGFSPADAAAPWLPQPADWASRSVEAQDGVAGSTLELYRQALKIREAHPALGDGTMRWLDDAPADALAFARDPGFQCWVNFGDEPVVLPADVSVLVASGPLTDDGELPTDTAAWVVVPS
jgi:alpha-glucosidase